MHESGKSKEYVNQFILLNASCLHSDETLPLHHGLMGGGVVFISTSSLFCVT